MDRKTLIQLINDDDLGLLDIPKLTPQEQEIVDAFAPFLTKILNDQK